ncbi:MAG: AAA family ATPase [Thiofilum sp.]|uniref:AAA family ATPase n=1 Tax=Thiofilum sp. TaxID=2212733 RepID=UPI00345A9823
MKIPYGLSNFATVIKEHYSYIDKTSFIRTLEDEGRHNVLLRPRRFGKSLFLSMLYYYYDINSANDFNTLFGHLAIGQNPTPKHNQYQILFLEFSGIAIDNHESVYTAFSEKITNALLAFLEQYGYASELHPAIIQASTPAGKIDTLLRLTQGKKIYLLIDEYDHFANALLADDLDHFRSIMGKGGFVRAFYEAIKTGTQKGVIDRLFITGVTPIVLDSLTSGFNVVDNLTLNPKFNEAIGFTRVETESLLKPLTQLCPLSLDSLITTVTQWYNGYHFAQEVSAMYNSDMVLYFIKRFDQRSCSYPEYMLDENIASDYGKILAMFNIGHRDDNYEVLEELLNDGFVVAKSRRKFDFDKGFDRDDFVSLLYYMGFIAFDGNELTQQRFVIPNYVIKVLYFEYFKIEIERRNQIAISNRTIEKAVIALALYDDIEPLRLEAERVLKALSNRDFLKFDEKHIKMLLVTLLYQSAAYFIQSEPEINQKYPDILLLERSPFAVKYEHLIELKFCKQSERKKHLKLWDEKREQGLAQVQSYLQLPDLKDRPKLSAWVMLTDGEEVVVEKVYRS